MSDVVLVSFIGSAATIAVAVIAQVIGMLTAARQAERVERLEAAKHKREHSERIRVERKKALNDLYQIVEAVQIHFSSRGAGEDIPPLLAQPSASTFRGARIATLEVPELRAIAEQFHTATAEFQNAVYEENVIKIRATRPAFESASNDLLDAIAQAAEQLQKP